MHLFCNTIIQVSVPFKWENLFKCALVRSLQPLFHLANAVLILKLSAASPKQHLVHFVPAETDTQKFLVLNTNQRAWCITKGSLEQRAEAFVLEHTGRLVG